MGARLAITGTVLALLAACGEQAAVPAHGPIEVTATTITPRDTAVALEAVAQTQSSREVEIRARVEGFLEERRYTEGELVRAGQTMFQMDRKPFEAALLSAKGQLAQQQARWEVAKANLARVRPLAEQNAVSKKDLDDAVGNEQQAQAAVLAAQGQVQTAELNLSYTTITTPLTGLSSYARKQEGSLLTPGEGGLLTYVSQLDPIWVNFSISENEILRYREEIAKGQLIFPADSDFEVELTLANGALFPNRGRLSFADPSFSKDTGTFLVRAVFVNPKGVLRPGQFVRAKVRGAIRPNAILVPQRAVLQGAKSHYVWVIDKDGKAEQRIVDVGEWYGDEWFIKQGLRAGERVVVDGAIRLSDDVPLKVVQAPAALTGKEQEGTQSQKAAPLSTEKAKPGSTKRDAKPAR